MIRVQQQQEPESFEKLVRTPGRRFLKRYPHPNHQEWNRRAYWQKVLPVMREAYGKVCAYCAHWIPHSTGGHSIDHFLPRSTHPELAYEWKNFRYVSRRFNSRKGTRTILDPFSIEDDWFVLDFSSFLVRPNPNLPLEITDQVLETISILKLNDDEDLVTERLAYVCEYCQEEISLTHMEKKAPFIAAELKRQGLVDEIRIMMKELCSQMES